MMDLVNLISSDYGLNLNGEMIDEIDKNLLYKELLKQISTLTDREQQVLLHRYFDDLTLQDTAEILDITRERVRQLQLKAERKLSHPVRAEKIVKMMRHLSEKEFQERKRQQIRK